MEERLGPHQARRRLGIETDTRHKSSAGPPLPSHRELVSGPFCHSKCTKLTGLYWRGRRNTGSVLVKRNDVMFKELPPLSMASTILHLSDMHVDMNEAAMQRLIGNSSATSATIYVFNRRLSGKNLDRSKQP